jgi:hypothetical protein
MFPIYIPSKGRPKCLTAKLLSGLNYYVVVEPQDADAYAGLPLVVLPANNQGIGYSRNWIKSYSANLGEKYHWQIDDDMKSFCSRVPGKPFVGNISPELALMEAELLVAKYCNIGELGIGCNAWPPPEDYLSINKQPHQCILINNDTKSNFRSEFNPVEDLDFTLQVLTEGWCTILMNHLRTCSVSATSGKLRGKIIEYDVESLNAYRIKVRMKMEKLCAAWPSLPLSVKMTNDGRPQIRRGKKVWAAFKQRPLPSKK